MATLMRYNHPKLGLVKCDAACYNAQEKACDCICQGSNHGIGFKLARENTTKNGHEMIVAYERKLEDYLRDLL